MNSSAKSEIKQIIILNANVANLNEAKMCIRDRPDATWLLYDIYSPDSPQESRARAVQSHNERLQLFAPCR